MQSFHHCISSLLYQKHLLYHDESFRSCHPPWQQGLVSLYQCERCCFEKLGPESSVVNACCLNIMIVEVHFGTMHNVNDPRICRNATSDTRGLQEGLLDRFVNQFALVSLSGYITWEYQSMGHLFKHGLGPRNSQWRFSSKSRTTLNLSSTGLLSWRWSLNLD